MLASNFNECSYVFRRGRDKGRQCNKSTLVGICANCLNINLLTENIFAHNNIMISKCIDSFIYSYDEIHNSVLNCNRYSDAKIIIKNWLKSKSQNFFIKKYWLFSQIDLINDVIGGINQFHYDVQYKIIIKNWLKSKI